MTALRRVRASGVAMLARPGRPGAIPLVLLHGVGSNAQTWAATISVLDSSIPVIAWDAPGYGESDPLGVAAPTPAHYAERVHALLETLQWPRVMLAGHSLGAMFACRFAAAHPQRVAGLAVMSPALGYQVADGAALPAAVQARIDDLNALGPAAFAAARAGRLLYRPETKPDMLAAVRAAMAALHPAGYAQAVHALGAGDLLADAATITVPSVVATGTEDVVTPPANAHAAHAALRSRTPVLCVADAGHALPQEAPAAVAGLLARLAAEVQHA